MAPETPIQIEALYDQYAHLVYRRCLVLLGNQADAEDALQEVFVRAMRAAAAFRGDSSAMTWLYRIATNHCLNVLRAHRRLRARLERQAHEPGPAVDQVAQQIEAAATVRALLPDFDPRTQLMVVHYFVDGMSQEEVAQEVGASLPTVRKYLRKFIEKANKRLERKK